MAAFTELIGFFTVIGSRDLPRNWSLSDNFGFDEGSGDSVFAYSMNDVNNSFQQPRELTRMAVHNLYVGDPNDGGVQEISTIIAESLDNDELSSENVHDIYWEQVYNILEYLFHFPQTAQGPADATGINKADEEFITNGGDYYAPNYTSGSIEMVASTIGTGRLKVVTFAIIMGGTPVVFTIYFTPDDLIEDYSNTIDRLAVYTYEDLDDNDTISESEFETQIIQKNMDILADGRYNSVYTFTTPKHDPSGVLLRIQAFYIYSPLAPEFEVSIILLKEAVKEYLIALPLYNGNLTMLSVEYPDLFADDIIAIFPLTMNNNGAGIDYHPIELEILRDELIWRSFGYEPNNAIPTEPDYRKTEIFYLGSESDVITPVYNYPMVAVEMTPDSNTRPVSMRFPTYMPEFSAFDGTALSGGDWTGETDSRVFHRLTFICIGLTLGDFLDTDEIVTQIPGLYNLVITKDGADIINIQFEINGVTFTFPKRPI